MVFEDSIDIIKSHGLQKTVFDKRALKVFHQPSMTWYFTEWKEKQYALGVTKHIKILPNDFVFKNSDKIGRAKIDADFPNAKYHRTEILYRENIFEALEP